MKKVISLLLCLCMLLSLAACGGETMSEAQFHDLLKEMPVYVASSEHVVQSDEYKALYPDMLKAVLQNASAYDVKDAVVAFAAWDKNGLPVKILGSIDFSDGSYIKKVNYGDINLAAGGTFGESAGYEIAESCGIADFEAIVVSFETFDGKKWENPYFDEWTKLYEGVKRTGELTVKVKQETVTFEKAAASVTKITQTPVPTPAASTDTTPTPVPTATPAPTATPTATPAPALQTLSVAEFEALLANQPLSVVSTNYLVQHEQYKSLYPDMLQAVLQSVAPIDIKSAVVAFAAWDKNDLPVKIKGSIDFSGGSYIKQVSYADINLIPGGTFGESSGFSVDENCGIARFKAIVVSYEDFAGEVWENPYFDEWTTLYEGVKYTDNLTVAVADLP